MQLQLSHERSVELVLKMGVADPRPVGYEAAASCTKQTSARSARWQSRLGAHKETCEASPGAEHRDIHLAAAQKLAQLQARRRSRLLAVEEPVIVVIVVIVVDVDRRVQRRHHIGIQMTGDVTHPDDG